jgi:hypothetical protein
MVIFLLMFTWLPPSYVPVVLTAYLVVRWLIGITRHARTSGTAKTYPESESSLMTCLLDIKIPRVPNRG